jgi:type IV pilus assembly protein PilN
MIRINLAKSMMEKRQDLGATETMVEGDASDKEIQKQGLLRILLLLSGPIFMFVYEMQTIPGKNQELQSRTAFLSELTEQNAKAQAAVDEIKKFEEDKAKIQAQIDIIENLKKTRMQPVRVLDSIQRNIPSKVWLISVDLNQNGNIIIQGYSTTDLDLTAFMDGLSRSVFLRDVMLVKSNEEIDESGANLKKFEISCALEKLL